MKTFTILSAAFLGLMTLSTSCQQSAQKQSEPDYASVEARILSFYRATMTDSLVDIVRSDSEYLTPRMVRRLGFITVSTDADPFLRAQDYNENMRQTLLCKHLYGKWFEVSFSSDDKEQTRIPVRVDSVYPGACIDYVVPQWGGTAYGDSLFEVTTTPVDNQQDALTFVQSFYGQYTNLYIQMPESLTAQLLALRTRYCTEECQKLLAKTPEDFYDYEQELYDPVIDDFGFDAFAKRSLQTHELLDSVYSVTYSYGKVGRAVKVDVTKTDQGWMIKSIVPLTAEGN